MVRTSRHGAPSTSVQALDHLDLDDMFADGGDDLFDGLDIDLGNMDDITGGNNVETKEETRRTAAAAAATSSSQTAESDEAPQRRKTKRKTTAPAFFDDQDEDFVEEPPKKKKRGSTKVAPSTKKKASKKAAAQNEVKPPAASAAATRKSKNKSMMPPPASIPAPAGPKKKGTILKAPPSAAGQKSKRQQQTIQSLPSHPGLNQSPFCGLLPSKSLFYPFMPSLPQEVALKNKKIYALLDKVHSSFSSQINSSSNKTATNTPNGVQPVSDTEVIIQIMQEAFKDEKAPKEGQLQSKNEIICKAVANIRATIGGLNEHKLVQDLMAVCALLKRQYDFLKQNAINMEQWCRDNFKHEDYSEVYMPEQDHHHPKPGEASLQRNVLSSFNVPRIRVKLICSGFKEPKAPLHALLPKEGPLASLADAKKTAKASKKRKAPTADAAQAPAVVTRPLTQQELYAQSKPAKRRKGVADLISRAGHALETQYLRRIDQRRQAVAAKERRSRDTAMDQSYQVIHTVGMWKWLDEMGYCDETVTDASIRERLEDARSLNWDELEYQGGLVPAAASTVDTQSTRPSISNEPPVPYADLLLDLLVDEGESDTDVERSASSDEERIRGIGLDELEEQADISHLTQDERVYLLLRSSGLCLDPEGSSLSTLSKPQASHPSLSTGQPLATANESAVGTGHAGDESNSSIPKDEIDDLLKRMTKDLLKTMNQNNRRASYLETMAQATLVAPKESKLKKIQEAQLNGRHAAIIKRNKEAKSKLGKNRSTKVDDLALPW